MKIDDIITFDDNLEYLILDIVELNQEKFMYCVQIDSDEKPTDKYICFKSIEENGEYYTEEVEDTDILKSIMSKLTNNINNITNDEQDV